MNKQWILKSIRMVSLLLSFLLLAVVISVSAFGKDETEGSHDDFGIIEENTGVSGDDPVIPEEEPDGTDETLEIFVDESVEAEISFTEAEFTASVSSEAKAAKAAAKQTFYSNTSVGDGDVLYYTYIGSNYTPAYCIEHGKDNPNGNAYSPNSTTNNKLGYIMRHGYPAKDWDLNWKEAQFLTQCAVFGVMGVNFYTISDGIHSPYWIWNHIWGNGKYEEGDTISNYGHFQYAINLYKNANSKAESEDASYVKYWTPSNSSFQKMVTPVMTGKVKISKTVSNAAGSLMISKTTSGAASDSNREFQFKLVVKNASGTVQSVSYSFTGSKSGTISGNNGTVKLKSGQSITVSGIPAGYSYTVTETEDPLYTTNPANRTSSGKIPSVSTTANSFTFKVTFSDGGTYSYSGSKSGSIQSGKTLTLTGGQSVTISEIPKGVTYTVSETAVSGYKTTSSGASGTVAANATSTAKFTNAYQPAMQKAAFTNTRKTTTVEVSKMTSSTAAAKQLEGNAMYSQNFSGAKFQVEVIDANTGSVTSTRTYTTGTNGKFSVSGLYVGDKVRITEMEAPKGYVLPSAEAEKVKTVTLAASGNMVSFKDEPAFDTAGIRALKVDSGNPSVKLEDAVFQVEYFDSLDIKSLETAVRTWYFRTDQNGTWDYASSTPVDNSLYDSDLRYTDAGGNAAIPIGTVRITEIKSPDGYKRNEAVIYKQITQKKNQPAVGSWVEDTSETVTFESNRDFTMGDEKKTMLPVTGDGGIVWMPVCGGFLLLLCLALYGIIRNGRGKENQT